jgi:alpha-ribazole phosphatase
MTGSGYNALVKPPATTELLLIRHAPARNPGLLAGRSDVPVSCTDATASAALRAAMGPVDHRVMSPALRCVQTATALWPDMAAPQTDARLWEQDFGDWEGLAMNDLPDLGSLPPETLAAHRPPGGESFDDLCTRTHPALAALAARGGRIAVIAHAGTVRAALALALRSPGAALAFQVAPLSLTQLSAVDGTSWSIGTVNWTARGNAS